MGKRALSEKRNEEVQLKVFCKNPTEVGLSFFCQVERNPQKCFNVRMDAGDEQGISLSVWISRIALS